MVIQWYKQLTRLGYSAPTIPSPEFATRVMRIVWQHGNMPLKIRWQPGIRLLAYGDDWMLTQKPTGAVDLHHVQWPTMRRHAILNYSCNADDILNPSLGDTDGRSETPSE